MSTLRDARSVVKHVWRHPANRDDRAAALLRACAFQIRGRRGRRTLTRIGVDGVMWAELHYTASSSVVYANPPDWNEMRAWQRILRPGDRFIDVGSNVGSYALWAAGLGARVIAVEPSADAYTRLQENVALNAWDITTLRCALSSHAGTGALTSGLGTVNHLVTDATTGAQGAEPVPLRTLDELVAGEPVAGVKIDVEGAERLVLEGATSSLADQAVSVLQLEWNEASQQLLAEPRDASAEVLRSFGYELYRPDGDGRLQPTQPTAGSDVFAVSPRAARSLSRS